MQRAAAYTHAVSATADAFASHCVELLAPLGAASAKRMFGGHGLDVDGLMVDLIADEQLYLETDAQSLPQWQTARAATSKRPR